GSLGIDLATTTDVTLVDTKATKIPTGIHGPIYHKKSCVGALLIGRSSTGLAGLVVLPGVIDAGHTGEIMISAFTPTPPLTIRAGTRIAQLIPIEQLHFERHIFRQAAVRGDQGFGSSGNTVSLVQTTRNRPVVTVQISGNGVTRQYKVMMDTGADMTIFT
ncbi:POK9 protein, partial [Pomatostomus ruficeps]|nr:POK9 protein [Pomatostomus ruficeps]